MYEEIIENIKSNLGENRELNIKYLSGQMEVYRDHPHGREILGEISRLMWDCLSEEEKRNYAENQAKENPIMNILDDIYPDVDGGNYEPALEKLDAFMKNFNPIFENDDAGEYHYFTNLLEELVFLRYIGSQKEIIHIPENQPLLDLYYIYGFLLLETGQLEKAEEYLKKAIEINPVSSRIILELTEIYRIHTYTLNEFFIRTCDALKYAYSHQDIARCYRNLGHYYIEENLMETALALFQYSMEYEMNPLAYREIRYIQSRTDDLNLTGEECREIIKGKNIQTGPNPFILDTLDELCEEYMENKLYSQGLYFLEIRYNLSPDEETLEKIELAKEKLNY